MRKVESVINLPKITVKELIDTLKMLNPETPLQKFTLQTNEEYGTRPGEPPGIITTYNFNFSLRDFKKK